VKVRHEEKAKDAAKPVRRLTNLLGLFAVLVVLASASAAAEEPSAASSTLTLRLSLVEPQDGAAFNDPKRPVRLKIEAVCGDAACPARQAKRANKNLRLTATLNGQNVSRSFTKAGSLATSGGVQMTYAPKAGLPEGENALLAQASVSRTTRSNQIEARFTVDTAAPRFLEVSPDDGAVLEGEKVTIAGKVDDAAAEVSLEGLQELGGTAISDDPGGFSFEVPLKEGENSFKLLAQDAASNRGEKSLTLVRQSPIELAITEPGQGSTVATDKVDVRGTVKGPDGTTVTVGQVEASVDPQGSFVARDVPLVEGPNSVVVQATAPGGRSVQRTLEVTYEPAGVPPDTEPPVEEGTNVRSERPPGSPVPTPGPLPPDPSEVAPDVEEGVATDTFESTKFLYEGENAVQTGVAPGTIEEKRVAVLKGKVLDRLGGPVPGVRVTVLDHPELGQTLTREDGAYDIAVNGGGAVTLVYEKDLYMPAQRQVEAPWRDFAAVEDVVLVGFSRRITDVDL
jgi:hypothetical protein